MTSCNCKHLAHIGKDFNGNIIIYNPLNHSIKECYKPTPTPTCTKKYMAHCNNLPCCSNAYCRNNFCVSIPECNTYINEKQCTAWQNFLMHYQIKVKIVKKKCGNIYEDPCLCSDLITCSAEHITGLKFNDIQDISFNLSSIVDFSNLELIATTSSYINGSLSDLSSMYKLTILDCTNATLNGNLNNFSKMSGLQYIDLFQSVDISGDISSLISLKQLQYIDLNSSPNITGDISLLSKLTDLSSIAFGKSSITGELSSLSSLKNLESISLGGNIIGDISSLSHLNLQWIQINDLFNKSSITGDLSLLRNMTKLHGIDIDVVGIKGNLSDLSSMSELSSLSLSWSINISGNLSHLSNMYNLKILDLNKARYITGNLNSLQKLNLSNLYINETKLDGSCSDISNLLQNFTNSSGISNCILKVEDTLCLKDFSKNCKFIIAEKDM